MLRWKSSTWISYVLTHPALTAAGWIQSCLSTELKLTTASFSSLSPADLPRPLDFRLDSSRR